MSADGAVKRSTTVAGSGASTAVTRVRLDDSGAPWAFLSRSRLSFTAVESSGAPSLKVTF